MDFMALKDQISKVSDSFTRYTQLLNLDQIKWGLPSLGCLLYTMLKFGRFLANFHIILAKSKSRRLIGQRKRLVQISETMEDKLTNGLFPMGSILPKLNTKQEIG